jgi:hypothetical protein
MDILSDEEKILRKIHKICPKARSCYHAACMGWGEGYIIHGKYSLPINEEPISDKYSALINALDILKGRI